MPKTVLIILAAVVALIVIVVLTGMRYLRADDEDEFDDGVPAEHGRSRSNGGHPPADQARPRQRHADDRADDRQRERVGATRAARPVRGGDELAADRRGPDQRVPGRRADDRSWPESQRREAGPEGRRPSSAARDQRPARSSRRDRDISEPMAAVSRPGRSVPARGGSRGGDDFDSQPGRRVPDYDRDSRDRLDSRVSRMSGIDDDYARKDSRDRRDGRSPAGLRDDYDRDAPDRRSTTRPNARPDARKNASAPDEDLLPAVKSRQGRGKRDDEGDWPSNEWDELSDVDFWAEMASDKPFSAQESAEPAKTARRGSRADRDARSVRSAKPERSSRQDRDARLDGTATRSEPSGRPVVPEPVTKQLSRPSRELDAGLLPAARHQDLPGDLSSVTRAADLRPAVADDDPLTSPSFPRISGDDSRSYRRTRPGAADSRHGSGTTRLPAEPPSYPGMPRVEPVRGIDTSSTTRRHSLPAASAAELTDGYRTPVPGFPAGEQAPAADPYGSLPASGSGLAGYQPPAPASYGADSATASYSVPARSGSYQLPGEAPYTGSGGYHGASGGYLPPAGNGNGNGYAAETRASSYDSLPPALEPYHSDLGSGGYQATSGYSLPPAYGPGPGDLAGGYPANDYQPADYQGYGEATPASGSHRRPEPGYANGSYSGGAEHALPAAQPDLGYPVYSAPVAAGQNGYDTAPYQGGYDPAGYQVPAQEPDGYAGADPYAVDPYGQNGYGGTGY